MGLFSFLTGSQKKTNLTPDINYPNQDQLYFTSPTASKQGSNLRDFAANRIAGNNLGFGNDFVDRQSSPGIAQIDANFQNRTMPTLSSNASKRGLARSSIVQDQIGQADQSRNRDISSMVANFQMLNEQQKKTDQNNAVGIAQGLQGEQLGMMNNAAAASERQVGRNTEGDKYAQQYKDNAGKNIMAMIASAIGAGTGMPMGSPVGLGTQPGIGATSTYGANNVPQGFGGMMNPGGQYGGGNIGNMVGAALGSGGNSGVRTQILGQHDANSVNGMTPQQIQQLLQQYFGG